MKSVQTATKRPATVPGSLTRAVLAVVLVGVVVLGLYRCGQPLARGARPRVQPATAVPVDHLAMPVGDRPGWREVFFDNFDGSHLDRSKWRLYWGQPGGDPAGWYDPGHVSVSHGMLIISAYRDPARGDSWATGGVSSSPGLVQTYGKYLVRFRLDAGIGVGHALVLFPANNSWPPEIDFSEDNGSGRNSTLATLHYGAADHHLARKAAVNLTQWHTLGVEWLPGSAVFTLDGRDWFRVVGNAVPDIPMVMDIQTENWPCTGTWGRCPDASTPNVVRMEVDWVVAYAPASSRLSRFAGPQAAQSRRPPSSSTTQAAG